jgi:hypothetical protein
MTDDEYQRIKDAEKKRLRAKRTLRRLKEALRAQQKSGRGTVARMTDRIQTLFNDHRSAVDALQWDTARLHARLDALRDTLTGASTPGGTQNNTDTDAYDSTHDESTDDSTHDDEATLRRCRAEKLIDDLRTQLTSDAPGAASEDTPTDSPTASDAPKASNSTDDSSERDTPDDGLPEKTIGRMSRS